MTPPCPHCNGVGRVVSGDSIVDCRHCEVSGLQPLREPSKSRRWYWSCRPDSRVPERLGVNALWGMMFDSWDEAIRVYKEAEEKYG